MPGIDPQKGLTRLQQALGLEAAPNTIEGFDISHLQGDATVGACVTFIGGIPQKGGYRRFKVKSVEGIDDFACLKEIVTRRYSRLLEEKQALPDIILIDGGVGQMNAARQALKALGIEHPGLVSIAKREETLYTPARKDGVRLARRNEGLRLLQYVRDEAHRFAQHYHHFLRHKRTFDE